MSLEMRKNWRWALGLVDRFSSTVAGTLISPSSHESS